MPFVVADLVAKLSADTGQFRTQMGQAESSIGRVRSAGNKLGQLAGAGFGLGGGIAAFSALTSGVKAVWNEMEEAQAVAAQTAAVIKSTGGAAHVSAQDVEELGDKLLKLSGKDDEAIKSGANLLLTFKSIRNEAGKGNDIFNQAVKMALDLSIAWKTDMKSASIQLGKALEDPISGLTSLRRVGIQFTDQQELMIRGLVEAGDQMGAQKLILAELETQVGGSAAAYGETMAGKVGKAREQLKNVSAEIMERALPALAAMATFIGGFFVAAMDKWTDALNNMIYLYNLIPGHKDIRYAGVVEPGSGPGGLYGTGPGGPNPYAPAGPLNPGGGSAVPANPWGGGMDPNTEPWAGAMGGMVPGPIGAAVGIIAHGGEMVSTPAQQRSGGAGEEHVHIYIGNDKLVDIVRKYENVNGVGWRTVWTN